MNMEEREREEIRHVESKRIKQDGHGEREMDKVRRGRYEGNSVHLNYIFVAE